MPFILPAFVVAVPAPADDTAALVDLVRRHTEAQRVSDQATLKLTTAEAFVEVSLLGDVDTREEVLSFYTPDKATTKPNLTVEEPLVRVFGDTGIVIARLVLSIKDPDGALEARSIRVTFVARREAGTWKLVSSQYTGIPPQRTPAPKGD